MSRQAKGYMVIADPDAPVPLREWNTLTCFHCNRIVRLTKEDLGGFCRMCMKDICGPCADRGECTPFEKKLKAYEDAAARGRYLSELLNVGSTK